MKWQYRTIVFEFAKDGLLGDQYINDEEMETALNEQGVYGWELVNVVMIQEGVLAVLKRSNGERRAVEETAPASSSVSEKVERISPQAKVEEPAITAEEIRRQEMEHIKALEEKRIKAMQDQEDDLIGTIKIN